MTSALPSTDFATNMTNIVSSYVLPEDKTQGWLWSVYVFLFVAAVYVLDFGTRIYRDSRLRKFGSSPPLVPFKMPLGMDIAIQILYRFFKNTFFELMSDWLAAAPGRTVELRMFAQGTILTDQPANIKAMMSTQFSSFGKGDSTANGGINIKTAETLGPHVGKLRPDDLEITEKHVQDLFNRFSIVGPVEVYDLIDRFQLDVTTHVFFGESANSLTSEPPFKEPMALLCTINTARQIFGKTALLFPDYLFAPKALRELNTYTTDITDRAYLRDLSKKAPEDYNMLDDLVSQKKSYKEIKESLMSIMLGGKDPSSILISWAIYRMAKHPHIFKKMQAEVTRVCGTRPPTASELHDLTYLRHVINETFRLHHPLGLNVRVAQEDITLPIGGGKSGKELLAVANGTIFIYSLLGVQRRKDFYGEDAEVFRPERWEETNVNRWHFIPYNHGPRICMGRNFGQQQMEYVLARICQEYSEILMPAGQREPLR